MPDRSCDTVSALLGCRGSPHHTDSITLVTRMVLVGVGGKGNVGDAEMTMVSPLSQSSGRTNINRSQALSSSNMDER
jgi:hypothetical protein